MPPTSLTPSQQALARKSSARWYPLKSHPVQLALVTDQVRFKVVPAGRRSGKTERAKRFMVREAMRSPGNYFVAAPTRDQVKRIYWQDLKVLSFTNGRVWARNPSETELVIYFANGSTISLIGLDQPQRMEGTTWTGGIIDEIANVKSGAWEENISPALDTVDPARPGYRPWCWLIGVPDGLNHYYEMAERARLGSNPDWQLYHWTSAEILPQDVIDAAMRRMSRRQFRQEYEASFETAQGKIYEDYSPRNYTAETIKPHERLLWCHDFNYTPLSSAVCVNRGGEIFVLDEIILSSAVARQSAMEFLDRYKGHQNKQIMIYGDPAGRAGEKHGQESNYLEIEKVLRDAGFSPSRRVSSSAPAIKDRQNAVRAMIQNAAGQSRLFVNTEKCPYTHRGLATVQFKKGSIFLEEDGEYQHITTALGYMIAYEFPIGGRIDHFRVGGV